VHDYFLIARVEQASGKDGFVKISLLTDFPERIGKLRKVYLDFWGDKKLFFIEETKKYKNTYLIKFKNFNSTRDSQVLIGRDIFVDKKDVVDLPENYFIIHDMLQSEVYIRKQKIGIVKDVLKTPANDVLVLKLENGEEKMIPFVLEIIDRFEPETGKLFLKIDKSYLEEDED